MSHVMLFVISKLLCLVTSTLCHIGCIYISYPLPNISYLTSHVSFFISRRYWMGGFKVPMHKSAIKLIRLRRRCLTSRENIFAQSVDNPSTGESRCLLTVQKGTPPTSPNGLPKRAKILVESYSG